MKIKSKLKNDSRKTEVEMLGTAMLDLKGESRERAMRVYRKLLSESMDDLMYLARV